MCRPGSKAGKARPIGRRAITGRHCAQSHARKFELSATGCRKLPYLIWGGKQSVKCR